MDVVACITPIQRTLSDEVERLQGINDKGTGVPLSKLEFGKLEFLRSKHFSWVNIVNFQH